MTDRPAALRFDRPVPPAAVNRRSVGEVFVTDSGRVGPNEFAIAVRVPRRHRLWSDRRAPWHDTLCTVEAFRQAFVVVRHDHLDVPPGTPTAVQGLTLSVEDLDAYRDDGRSPLDGVVHLRATRSGPRGDAVDLSGTFTVGAAVATTLAYRSILFPAASYQEIRAYQRSRRTAGRVPPAGTGRVEPAAVGRRDPANVVIGPASRPGRYPVVVDRTHPSFFDRGYDHIPGSLLIEVLRQGAQLGSAEAGLRPQEAAVTGAELDFTTFVELDGPAECTVSVAPGPAPGTVTALVGIDQHGARAAGGRLDLTPVPATG